MTKGYTESYARLIEFLGYRMRPPFTTEHLAISLMALAEGLAMRSIADTTVDRGMFGTLVAFVASAMVLAPGEEPDRDDPRERHLAAAVAPPRRSDIIDHLIRMFATERDDVPTVDELAARADCARLRVWSVTACAGDVGQQLRARRRAAAAPNAKACRVPIRRSWSTSGSGCC